MNDDEYEYRLTNRENSRKAKLGLHWCGCCDANLIGCGEKCGVCKRIDDGNRKRRNKK